MGVERAVTIEETFALMNPALGWSDLEDLASECSLPVLVKGLLTAEDAELAVEHGAAGVVVSNHGGRQLDRALATADALPEVVDAVDGRAAVLVDGGIRRGVDVADRPRARRRRRPRRAAGALGAGRGRRGRGRPGAGAAPRRARADPGPLRLRLARRAEPLPPAESTGDVRIFGRVTVLRSS